MLISTKDGQVDYESLKGMTKVEIAEKVRIGEVVPPPPRSPERTAFLEFGAMEPNSEERASFLRQRGTEKPENEPPADEVPSDPPSDPPADTPPTDPPADPPANQLWWQKRGFESEDEALGAIDALRTETEDLQGQIDRRNASDGKLGRKLKEAEDRVSVLESSREPPADPPEDIVAPVEAPKPPKLSDFENNPIDEDYLAARAKHDEDMALYVAGLQGTNTKVIERLNSLETEVKGVKSTTSQIQQARTTTVEGKKWSALWETMREAQGTYGLKTTVDIEKINAAVIAKNNGFLSSLPKSDLQAYGKIRRLCFAYADFGENNDQAPAPRFKRIKTAIVEAGLEAEFSEAQSVPLTPEEEKKLREKKASENANSVSAPPAGAGGDDNPAGDLTDEAASERLKKLDDMRRADTPQFQKNNALLTEFNSLRVHFGMKPWKPATRR